MTEPDDQQPDQRAERAFREALSEHADRLEPAPLTVPGRSSRRWPLLVAGAAAVVVLAVVATFSLIDADENSGGPDPSAATAEASDTPSVDALPVGPAPAGMHTVQFRGVSVDVPEEWVDDYIPNSNGCGYPTVPFVAVEKPSMGYTDQLCVSGEPAPPAGFPAVKRAEWVPNVQISSLASEAESLPDGETTDGDWTLTRATMGFVRIEVLTEAANRGLAAQIVESAVTVEIDANGCDATSPVQAVEFVRPEAFDLADIATVTSIAMCQYIRGDPTTPGLTGSTMLTGDDAQAELEAIQAAPAGGGPDNPQNCAPDLYGDSALVLRLGDQDATASDLYVYYDWCFGNGFDDGTTRRAITADNCPALFSGAVQQFSGDGSTFALCHPQGS